MALTNLMPISPNTLYAILLSSVVIPLMLGVYALGNWIVESQEMGRALKDIPGPKRHWLFGTLNAIPGFGEDGIAYFRKLCQKYPRMLQIWVGPFRPMVLLYHPETVKPVLTTAEPKQVTASGGYNLFRPWLGDGLLVSKGEKWLRNRRLITHGFHFDVLKPYITVYNECADILIEKWSKASANNQSVEITSDVSRCTLDVLLRCAFTIDLDVQSTNHPYTTAVTNGSRQIIRRTVKPWFYQDWIYFLSPEGRKFRRNLNVIHQLSADVIREKKAKMNTKESSKPKKYPDFLDILLLARDEDGKGLSDEELKDEVDTFLFGGHDTTSCAISWILYTLAKNPEEQEKCREEIDNLIQDLPNNHVDWNAHQNLEYTSLCIKECLRMLPPIPVVGRELTKPMTIDGITLPEGTLVNASMILLHHNEAVWGEDHDEFKPERFLPENMTEVDPFAYVPFSAGPRNCIGQTFGTNEIKVIVPRIIHRFRLRADPDHKLERENQVVLRAANGIKLYMDLI